MYRSHVLVCGGTGCTSSGSQQIMVALREELKKQGLDEEVSVVQTGCHGLCALGPIMIDPSARQGGGGEAELREGPAAAGYSLYCERGLPEGGKISLQGIADRQESPEGALV